MSEMERQLRVLMNIAVGDPPHHVNAETVRSRAARRRAAAAVAATVAVLLVGGFGAIVSAWAAGIGHGTSPAGGSGRPVGVPRYYVEQGIVSRGHPETVVRARATGAVTASVHCPWPKTRTLLMSVAAASNETFFAVCAKTTGQDFVVTASRIYRFRVTASGHIRGYSLVRGGVLDGLRVGGIAATPDGKEIAVSVTPGSAQGTSVAPGIIVINARTGAHAVWQGTPHVPGTVRLSVIDLSLTRDGRELVFLTSPRCIKGPNAPPCKVTGGEQVRALAPAARGGRVASSRVLLRQGKIMRISAYYINAAVVSPDGSTVTLAIVGSGPGPRSGSVSVAQYSAATGKRLRVVFLMHTGNGFSYRCFSSDPSGRHFILDAGPTSGAVNGWIDHGRLVRLKPAGDNVDFEVW
ncbi:MAG TPA: hypothetical protein VF940_30675 [Streptosporangiaceae bacterium]